MTTRIIATILFPLFCAFMSCLVAAIIFRHTLTYPVIYECWEFFVGIGDRILRRLMFDK